MAVTETLSKVQAKVVLNNGVDSEGKLKTVSVGLGTLSADGYDAQKIMNVITALVPCLAHAYYGTSVTKTENLYNG